MNHAPNFSDSDSDEFGFSDDGDYYDFKERIKKMRAEKQIVQREENKLEIIYNSIALGRSDDVIAEFDNGLDVNVLLPNDWRPLQLSAAVGNLRIFSALAAKGADMLTLRDESTILHLACNIHSSNNQKPVEVLEIIKLALENGVDPNYVDRKRRTALMLAASNGHFEAVKLLLPLTDKMLEDNQHWTVLFWAVEGHQIEIVEYLLTQDMDPYHLDIRQCNAIQLAEKNGFVDMMKLFPSEDQNDVFVILNRPVDFEEIFQDLDRKNLPILYSETCKVLFGCNSESVAPTLLEKNVSFLDLLSMNDEKLRELGVLLPFQRQRIIGGLFRFHKHPFNRQSMPYVPKNGLFSNIDISCGVFSCIRQIIAMQASLRFIKTHIQEDLSLVQRKELKSLIKMNVNQVKRLKLMIEKFAHKTEKWDSQLKPVDRITKKRWNIPWGHVFLSFMLTSVILIVKKVS